MRRAGLRADNHDIDYYLQGVYKSRFLPLPEGKNHGVVLPISSFQLQMHYEPWHADPHRLRDAQTLRRMSPEKKRVSPNPKPMKAGGGVL